MASRSTNPPHPVDTVIPCRVVALGDSEEAECSMIVSGYELPRVDFPAAVLRAVGLAAGDYFLWTVRDPEGVVPADLVAVAPPSLDLTPEKKAELDRLYAEFERDRAEDGGTWPICTVDGA
jgi:hypothetical protein